MLTNIVIISELEQIQAYIDAFKFGAPPNAGGGIGKYLAIMVVLKYLT